MAVQAAPSSDEAFRSLIEAHSATLSAIENIAHIVEGLQEHRHGHSTRKPLAESKCVSNLKVLSSDKSEFKNWNEKLINATSQTFGVAWRQFMKALNRRLDQDRKVLNNEELSTVDRIGDISDPGRCSEDLYYVLVEKTEGDAALRVSSGEPGEGLRAYMRVYLWFAGTTGLALTEKTRMLKIGRASCRERV